MGHDELRIKFKEVYGTEGKAYFAPGRVNLIGEHIDYNGGLVLPAALKLGINCLISKRNDDKFHFYSTDFDGEIIFNPAELLSKQDYGWACYPVSVILEFKKISCGFGGFNIMFKSNLPIGAGLSSSACIELLTAFAVNSEFKLGLSLLELIKLSKLAENNFVGVSCGIMDQFAIGMGREGHVILLDCSSLEFEHIPLDLDGHKLVIINSNKQRSLAESRFNERQKECYKALADINSASEIQHENLCSIGITEFLGLQSYIKDNNGRKRAEHAVFEQKRVIDAKKALISADLAALGRLLNQSHDSLSDLFEVSCPEINVLISEVRNSNLSVGSRMTGAGFGGCCLAIVKECEHELEEFTDLIGRNYFAKTGLKADFYMAETGRGVCRVE